MNDDSVMIVQAESIKDRILRTALESGQPCHIGGSLSIVHILATLFSSVIRLNTEDPQDPTRDIFILSKGHCVLAYYATLCEFGFMREDVLSSFQRNGSDLIAHPVKNETLGIESSNGSLGQGLSFGLGIALGMQLDKMLDRRVYVLMGDGECNEGSVWEAAGSAAEFNLCNLTAIVDLNGLRNDGSNSIYSDSLKLRNIWEAFGWNVVCVDGHHCNALKNAFDLAAKCSERPTVILAKTIKGKGVKFMEGNNDWHHNRLTAKVFEQI